MGSKDTGIEIELVDSQNDVAMDNNKTLDLFIYKLPRVTPLKPFFKKNSHTIFTCSSDVTEDFTDSKISAIVTTQDGEVISNGTSSSSLAKILRRNKTLSAYTNEYKGRFENNAIYIAVLKDELDVDKANLKDQNIFYIRNIDPTTETPENIEGILNAKGNTTLEMVNFDLLEDEFLNARAYYTRDEAWNTKDAQKIFMDIQKQSLLNSIKVKGKQNNGLTDVVPVKTPTRLVPVMFNPISSQDELELYSPWLDYDFALTFANAKKFTQAKSISEILANERQQKLLLDLILITYAYATDFNFVDYVIEGNDAGKIKGNQWIGYSARQASSLTSKTPLEIIDTLFESYIRDNPQDEDSDEIRFIQQSIAALSRWINSSKAIGKGNNSFNKIYLPFTLRIFAGLNPVKQNVPSPIPTDASENKTVESWTLKDVDTKFVLQSKYFSFTADKITNDKVDLLNELKLIQLDTKTTIPFLDDNVAVINKTPKPGDIDTTSAKDIKYLFYTNIPETNLSKFFAVSNVLDTTTPKGTKVTDQTTSWTGYGEKFATAEDIFKHFGYQGNFISGTIEEQFTPIKTLTLQFKDASSGPFGGVTRYATGTGAGVYGAGGYESKEKLAEALKVNPDSIKDYSVSPGGKIYPQTGKTWTLKYRISHERLVNLNYEVTIAGGQKISALKRKATFDKYSWKKEIDQFSSDPSNPDQKYSLEIDLNSSIIELDEILLRQIWGEEITFHVNGLSQTIYLHNANDETIGVERVLFR